VEAAASGQLPAAPRDSTADRLARIEAAVTNLSETVQRLEQQFQDFRRQFE
jgi:hypothetical protein